MFVDDVINRFRNRDTEKAFRTFYISQSNNLAQIGLPFYALTQFLIILTELMDSTNRNMGASRISVPIRMIIILLYVFALYGVMTVHKHNISAQKILRTTFSMNAVLLVLMQLIICIAIDKGGDRSGYMFYMGNWSLADSLFFQLMCFNCSGLLSTDVARICFLYGLAETVLPHFIFYERAVFFRISVVVLPVVHLFELWYSNENEWAMRKRYLSHIKAGEALCRQDKLIHSILPPGISNALKLHQYDKLMNFYPAVTILFCYIVDFTQHACANRPEDTVALCFRIVSALDHIVEQTGAYKVENIADTYMACAGCPTEAVDNARIMAYTAIEMIRASKRYNWRWPDGTPVELKIGLHSGSVTAGVVGTKSYSFHLFGDAVNTASRMCSNSTPGRILMSTRCHSRLMRDYSGLFDTSERGKILIKGKGPMDLFWLNGVKTKQTERKPLQAHTRTSETTFLERFEHLNESHSSKVIVNRLTLRFKLLTQHDRQNSPHLSRGISTVEVGRKQSRAREIIRAMSTHFQTRDRHCSVVEEVDETLGTGESPQLQRRGGNGAYDRMDTLASEYDYHPSQNGGGGDDDNEESPEYLRRMRQTVIDMENSFQQNNDIKSLSQQRQFLWVLLYFTGAVVLYLGQISGEVEFVLFVVMGIIALSLFGTKRWDAFINRSQLVVACTVLSTCILLRIRLSYSYLGGSEFRDSAALYIGANMFVNLFFRLRTVYMMVCFVVFMISGRIVERVDGSQENSISDLVYGFFTMIACLYLTYMREYMARVEYINIFLLDKEMKLSQILLANMLPRSENASALLSGNFVCEELEGVTLLYSDMKGFTDFASNKHPLELARLLDDIYSSFDRHLNHFGLYKIDIIGDAFVVVGGIGGRFNVANPTLNCVKFGFQMLHDLEEINKLHGCNMKLRIGIHTGNAVGSVISLNKPRYLIWGASTIIANHMESSGEPGYINMSREAMEKLDPLELNSLNIEQLPTSSSESEEQQILLACDDISDFLHEGDDSSEGNEDIRDGRVSLFSSAIESIKRLSGTKHRVAVDNNGQSEDEKQDVTEASFTERASMGVGFDEPPALPRFRPESNPGLFSPARKSRSSSHDETGELASPSRDSSSMRVFSNESGTPQEQVSSKSAVRLDEKFVPKSIGFDHMAAGEFVFETSLRNVSLNMPGGWSQKTNTTPTASNGSDQKQFAWNF